MSTIWHKSKFIILLQIPQAVDTAAIASTDSPVSFGKERICGRIFTAITNGKIAAVYTTSAASVCSKYI